MAELSHVTGSCALCKRSGLQAHDFFEAHLRQFIAERTTAFTDARTDTTKKTEVAGPSLCCRACIERQREAAAVADAVWNDGDGGDDAPEPHSSQQQPALNHQQEQVAESWEDD